MVKNMATEKVLKNFSLDREIVELIESKSKEEKLKASTWLNRLLHKLMEQETEKNTEKDSKKK
jgi:hypothetical protein